MIESLHVRWSKVFKVVELLVMGVRNRTLDFVPPKTPDYMQHYMMVLDQCDQIVVNTLAYVTLFETDQIFVDLVK